MPKVSRGIIKALTTIQGLANDGKIQPTAQIWTLENTGTVPLMINNIYKVVPGGRFGVDVGNLMAGGFEVKQITEYEIKFNGSASGDVSATRGATLFQTFLSYE